jgi:uncharacterized protein
VRDLLISNTGPLIALALIDRLDLLRSLFEAISVPETVHAEILQGGALGRGLTQYRAASWIEVEALQKPLDPLLTAVLDIGEASVIQLARERGADAVLIDERKARKIARTVYGLTVIGTARILVDAKRQGLLTSVGAELDAMRAGGYWIHDDIVNRALKEAGEPERKQT